MTHGRYRNGFPDSLYWLFMGLLVWLPLPIGSNRPIWVAVALLWLLGILILCVLAWMTGRYRAPPAFLAARLSWWLLGLFLAWQLLQVLFSCAAGCWLVPAWFAPAFEAVGADRWRWNLDPAAALATLYESFLIVGVFLTSLLLVDSRNRLRRMLWTLVWVGLVLAVVTGIFVMEQLQQQVFGMTLTQYGWATGSFINRNHFANYLVMTLCAGIGLLISMQTDSQADTWRQRIRNGLLTLMGPKARLRVFLALIVITLVLTRSRMGNMSFFASLLITGGLGLYFIRGRQRSLIWLIGSLVAIDILIVGSWFGMEQVVERIQQSVEVQTDGAVHVLAQDRLEATAETLSVISKVPITGVGGGGYYTLFPQMRQPNQKFLDHAHNDYVEFAVEFGLPAFLLLLALVLKSFWIAIRQLQSRNDPLALGAAFTSVMAMLAMGMHASVDFNLHIPANAATFSAILTFPWIINTKIR